MNRLVFGTILILVIIFAVYKFGSYNKHTKSSFNSPTQSVKIKKTQSSMKITSPVFENNKSIPTKYTCDGENINPPLQFADISKDTKSLVLILDDPDIPKNLKPDGVFDHWVVYNIPPSTTEFKEASTPPGTQGLNGAMKRSYTGPCPPDREHRYFFKLYALDAELDFENPEKADKKMVEEKMKGHILNQAEFIGLYNRTK